MNLIAMRRIIGLAPVLGSTLMVACGLRTTTASTETLTVYEDKPTLKLLDLGPPGNSPGDVYHFFAPLHSSPGGPVTGEVFFRVLANWPRAPMYLPVPPSTARTTGWPASNSPVVGG